MRRVARKGVMSIVRRHANIGVKMHVSGDVRAPVRRVAREGVKSTVRFHAWEHVSLDARFAQEKSQRSDITWQDVNKLAKQAVKLRVRVPVRWVARGGAIEAARFHARTHVKQGARTCVSMGMVRISANVAARACVRMNARVGVKLPVNSPARQPVNSESARPDARSIRARSGVS